MTINYMVRAIYSLRPSSQFVIHDGDYETIEWHHLDGKAPTYEEVLAEMTRLQDQDVIDEQNRAARRAEILGRLGITEDEAKLILS